MRKSFYKCALVCSSALVTVTPQLAFAQDSIRSSSSAQAAEDDDNSSKEIIVTGTQIRGIKPVGSSTVQQSREQIESSGKNDLNQILAQLPQALTFNGITQPGGAPTGGPATTGTISQALGNSVAQRPNLRGIPGTSLGTGAITLVMLDGHRIVPVGTNQSVIDLSLIPTNIIDRNEIMLDGASAIYGSDAVGGTINIIPRKRYDGVRVGAHYGFANNYWQRDANVVAGKNWGTGGFIVSYEYAANDGLLFRDRPYLISRNLYNGGGAFTGTSTICATPTIAVSGGGGAAHVSGSGIVAGAPAPCPANEWKTFISPQVRHSVYAGFEQEVSDRVKVELTGLYSVRTNSAWDVPAPASGIVQTSASQFYRQLPGGAVGAQQTLSFNLGPALGYDISRTDAKISFFNITPQVTVDVGSWQVRGLVDFGQSDTRVSSVMVDLTALPANAWSTVLNPYDVGSSSAGGLALLQGAVRNSIQETKQQFTQARIVADGPLFDLPGGTVRAAVGAEWMQNKVDYVPTTANFTIPPAIHATAASKSVFGEIVIPVISSENALSFMKGLTLSASGRYDDYGQYGTTFNPRLAATLNPVDWITVRGSWAKTFRAPNALDKLSPTMACGNATGASGCNAAFSSLANPLPSAPSGYNFADPAQKIAVLILGGGVGSAPSAVPENATNWSVGFDIEPPFVPGLRLSASYWEIHFRNQIARLGTTLQSVGDTALTIPGNVTKLCVPQNLGRPATPADATLCSQADIDNFAALGVGGGSTLSVLNAAGYKIVGLIDQRQNNLGRADVTGIDASVTYQTQTGFGSIDARAAIAIPTKSKTQASATALIVDALATGTPDYRITAAVGTNVGQFRAQLQWQFSKSYIASNYRCIVDPGGCTAAQILSATTTITRDPNQYRIGQFDTFDLFFRYQFNREDFLKDVDLTLSINNVLNSVPPTERTTTGGVAGGQTVGRMVQVGIAKRF